MKQLLLSLLAFALVFPAFAQDDAKKKWDVNAPVGMNYTEHNFEVTEGTWMNVDVSPDGKMLAFDLLGDIYTIPIGGGEAKCIRQGIAWECQPRFSPDGARLLFTSDAGGGDNIWVMNVDGTKANAITDESFRLLNNAVWVPGAEYIIARKHFTSQRSLGAGEMWMYHISGGDGVQLTEKKNAQQDVNEPCVSPDGNYVYFSEDMYAGGFFQYNKDPNKQIFAIRRYNRREGKIEEVTGGSGGAVRPQISPDGKWLSFVRRDYTKSVLYLHNLDSGEEFPIYNDLNKDQQEAWTIFGCYPGYAWMPDGKGLVVWAKGKLQRLTLPEAPAQLATYLHNNPDYRCAAVEIPFRCQVKTQLAETLQFKNKAWEPEFTANAIRQVTTHPDGRSIIFNAAGYLYKKTMPSGTPTRLTDGMDWEYEPSYAADGSKLLYVTWNDEQLGAIWVMDTKTGKKTKLTTEKGRYRTPSFSPDGSRIAYRKDEGDEHLGFVFGRNPGIYTMSANGTEVRYLEDIGENPRFSPDGQRIMVNTGGYLFGGLDKTLKSYNLDGKDEKVHFKTKYTNQWVPSPDGKWLAFTELHKAYICALTYTGKPIDLSGDTKAIPVAQVSRDAGYNLHWSADSKQLHWTLGEEYFTTDLHHRFAFLPNAPDSLPAMDTTGVRIGLRLKADAPNGTLVLQNARIITMEGNEVIENGTIVVKDNKILSIGASGKIDLPKMAKVIDCTGKTIMPGMVDAHAHSGNFRYGLSPQKQWEYFANLAYGVTTSHDPSANSEMVFSQSEMLKSGRMTGPRLFSTGTILYGADGDFKAPINSYEDALGTLRRTKAWGAFSVKSYNQPRRNQRQQVIAAARHLNMLVVPEGGSFFFHNMTQVVDGHTGVEHNIPVAPLYDDVIQLWKRTKSHNTPTLIVNYGSLNGEYYFYETTDVWAQKRLNNFTPRHVLDQRSRHRNKAPMEEYENGHILTSKSCTKLQENGVNINLGAHGQLQGLGAHWELWMLGQGGMSNHQALRCATINGASYIGMGDELGSLKAGKLADLLVLDQNPLENLRNSESIKYVMLNGRLMDAMTLEEVGSTVKRSKFWFEMPGGNSAGIGAGHSCTQIKCVCGH